MESDYLGAWDIHIPQDNMTTGKKFLFAIPWMIQLLLIIMIEVLLFSSLKDPGRMEHILKGHLPKGNLQGMIVCFFFVVVVDIATRVIYIVNAMKNPGLHKDNRTIWVVALALLGMIAQMIFWFKFIRKQAAAPAAEQEKRKAKDLWNT